MKKLSEHVYGLSAHLIIQLDDDSIHDITVYWDSDDGEHFKVDDESRKLELIEAYKELF